jgi:aldose sugar dehydrogenase
MTMSKVEKSEKNTKNCSCPGCPSYDNCAKEKSETLYCADEIGKNNCEFQKHGCLCGACPVHAEFFLKSSYYCIQGSADKVDGKIKI